ncbi:MAG: T9SS type A sorting domain-containing protein [Candidatus Krumholzibacteriota bacterium]|nr:T9SS type A sorting domain-containing protein [Candidatus Krumholzibacteriota bacterium]
MNPTTGVHTGTISFAGLADPDGIPEIDQLFLFRNLLFVSVQRLDRNNFFSPTASSDLAVIDINTNGFVDTDPITMGTQPITLVNPNPFSEIQLDPWTGLLYFSCVGFFGVLDAGVEMVDPLTLQSMGVIFTETEAGGDILDVEIVSDKIGYAIISTPAFVTDLISFNPQTGVKTATLYAPGDYVLQDIDRSPFGGELFLTDRTVTNPGVRCYNSLTGVQITAAPISTGLPPFDITFSIPVQTGVGDTPAVASLGQNYPNPFNPSTTIPWSLDRGGVVSLRIYDISGALVRTLVSGPVSAGAHEATWDGHDGADRPVSSGIYFARLITGTTTKVRKLALLK